MSLGGDREKGGGKKRGMGREEDREGEGGWCFPETGTRVGRPCLLLSPVLDTQNKLVEAVHMLEAGLVSD